MIHFFLHPVANSLVVPSDEHQLVPLHEGPRNTNEGGEFLDDALRMNEQPIIYTEESIAPGSPQNLF